MAQETQKSAAATEPVPAPAATQSPAPGPAPVQPPKTEAPAQPPEAEVPAGEKELAAPAPAVAPEKAAGEKEASAREPETTAEKPAAAAEGEAATAEAEKANITQSISFKEDSNVASELPEAQRKALEELKELVREALNKHEFTAPPPAPAKEEEKKEEKVEEKKEEEVKEKETKKEEKKEEKEGTAVTPATAPPATATSAVTETKAEEKPAAPATTVEAKKEEKPAAAPTKSEEKPAASAPTETKEEKTAAPETTEEKKEEKPAAPAAAEAKKEEKPAAPAAAEAKKEEKPAAPATTEAKKEEKPATPAPAETKPEVKPAASESITIEKAFAADEDGAKTVEAIKESIVPVSTPSASAEAPKEAEAEAEATPAEPEEVSIWGIPLLQDERSDVILLKFLRARDFKVKEAFTMLKNTVRWRKDFKIDDLLEEDLGNDFEKMVFVHGVDKQGRTVIYSSYSEFQNNELFSSKEKRNKFLKWRIQFQERCVQSLDFSPTAKSSFVFISDFKNAPGLGRRALWQFIKHAVKLFEDNYPEFVSKEVFINVPWWYIPYYRTIGSFTSPRTTSKMSLAGPSKSADAIFRYVAPEQVPVKYGGLSKESEQVFTPEDAITEVIVKPTAKHTVELPASEACTLAWELRVLGSDVSYGAQFEPSAEGSYTVIVSKNRKIGLTDEPVITDSFKVGEPGKVVITIDNQTSKKKKLLYRFKTQPRSD